MYSARGPYGRKKSIYAKRRHRNVRPFLTTLVFVVVAALVLFLGYSIVPVIQDVMAGKYKSSSSPSSHASSHASSSAPNKGKSSSASSGGKKVQTATNAVHGIFLPQSVLSDMTTLDKDINNAKSAGINLAVIELKGENGVIAYNSKINEAQGDGMVAPNAPDASKAAAELSKNNITPAAKISCFKDPVAPVSMHDASVLYSANHSLRWMDVGGSRWLNPYSQQAQQYIIDLAKEAVALGYKQIYLDDVEFPSPDGKAWYGDNLPSKEAALQAFVSTATQQIDAAGGKVSIMLPGDASVGSGNATAGQDQSIYGFAADYYSPNLSPSLMGPSVSIGGTAVSNPDLNPGTTVTSAANYLKGIAGDKLSKSVPFIQAFTNTSLGNGNYKTYTPDDINAEIAALKSAGINDFVLYAPDGNYTLTGINAK